MIGNGVSNIMIKYMDELKFYNRFINIKNGKVNWDFQFKKNNIIYARNGYGKTSFSLIFDSLATNKSLETKKSFDSNQNILIKLKDDLNNEYIYNNGWNKNIKMIEVFNSFYLEDNTYSIKFNKNYNRIFLEDMCDDQQGIIDLKKEISNINNEIRLLNQRRNKRKQKIRNKNKGLNKKQIFVLYGKDNKLQEISRNKNDKNSRLKELNIKYIDLIEISVLKYFNEINRILKLFCDDIEVLKPKIVNNQSKIELIYGIKINGYQIDFKEREVSTSHPLKYSLSDGDKNALSLSFFLAKINLLKNAEEYIVLIDDPLTSFDTFRKSVTIQELSEVSKRVSQLFLLTHDKYFARELSNKIGSDVCLLEINKTSDGNIIDISCDDNDTQLILINNLERLKKFCDNPSSTNNLLDSARCIRPLIESILKIKYADCFNENNTLGNMINSIKQSDFNSPLNRLKEFMNDLDAIRDYSNRFHHDNCYSINEITNLDELLKYAKRTIELFRKL